MRFKTLACAIALMPVAASATGLTLKSDVFVERTEVVQGKVRTTLAPPATVTLAGSVAAHCVKGRLIPMGKVPGVLPTLRTFSVNVEPSPSVKEKFWPAALLAVVEEKPEKSSQQ